MTKIDYSCAQYPIRAGFSESHGRYWKRLAAPGNWLTGAQRIEVAREVRHAEHCKLCKQRKSSLSPYQVDGAHDTASDLSHTMVEVVHRVVTDSGRLSKNWFEGLIEQGLKVEEYVEIIGTLVHVYCADEFCRGLGIPLNELPEPLPGEPSYYRPLGLVDEGAWVPMLPMTVDSGPESDIWEGSLHGNVMRALSLVPDEIRSLMEQLRVHYIDYHEIGDFEKSPHGNLNRIQTELVAARVASINECFY